MLARSNRIQNGVLLTQAPILSEFLFFRYLYLDRNTVLAATFVVFLGDTTWQRRLSKQRNKLIFSETAPWIDAALPAWGIVRHCQALPGPLLFASEAACPDSDAPSPAPETKGLPWPCFLVPGIVSDYAAWFDNHLHLCRAEILSPLAATAVAFSSQPAAFCFVEIEISRNPLRDKQAVPPAAQSPPSPDGPLRPTQDHDHEILCQLAIHRRQSAGSHLL